MTAPPVTQKVSLGRRKSLQLPNHPVEPPIPPSLLKSPYLNPQSIFQRTLSTPHIPSEEDEQWLQDTIPLSPEKKRGRLSTSSTSSTVSTDNSSPQPRPQSIGPLHAPPSPPIIRWRRPRHLLVPNWADTPRVRSAPCLAETTFFARP